MEITIVALVIVGIIILAIAYSTRNALPDPDETITTNITIGADRVTMFLVGQNLGLEGKALTQFKHSCDSLLLTLRVNKASGAVEIIAVDGKLVR